MSKIWLILQREYLTRVRKKSFVVMTILGPLLLAAVFAIPFWLATSEDGTVTVRVLDESGKLGQLTSPDSSYRFVAVQPPLAAAKLGLKNQKGTVLLYAPPTLSLDDPSGLQLFTEANLGLEQQLGLEKLLRRQIEQLRLRRAGIDEQVLASARVKDMDLRTTRLDASGAEKEDNAGLVVGIGLAGAFLIYMFTFLYGVQVMRGVMEEKTNRIVEVVISSVKPFQLMMGKILGIAAVGLTQFLLWVTLSYAVMTGLATQFGINRVTPMQQAQNAPAAAMAAARAADTGSGTSIGAAPVKSEKTSEAKKSKIAGFWSQMKEVNWGILLFTFIFYFLGGYLLYAALFGAVGAAVDQETDSQQFMLPITMPLILSIIIAQAVVINNPNGPVAVWMSMIPFTSPIIMVMRVPFGGVPAWQLGLSMGLLVMGFIGTTWIAGRIYRVGILLYGKKPSFAEMGKWLFYKG